MQEHISHTTEAYQKGYRAGSNGQSFIDNPYPSKTQDYKDWEEGRQEAVRVTSF